MRSAHCVGAGVVLVDAATFEAWQGDLYWDGLRLTLIVECSLPAWTDPLDTVRDYGALALSGLLCQVNDAGSVPGAAVHVDCVRFLSACLEEHLEEALGGCPACERLLEPLRRMLY